MLLNVTQGLFVLGVQKIVSIQHHLSRAKGRNCWAIITLLSSKKLKGKSKKHLSQVKI